MNEKNRDDKRLRENDKPEKRRTRWTTDGSGVDSGGVRREKGLTAVALTAAALTAAACVCFTNLLANESYENKRMI